MNSVVAEREAEAARLEGEMAQVCGVLNAGTGRLVRLIGAVLESGAWEGHGIRSPEQWVAWRCGVSGGRARQLVAMARRLPSLPQTRAALEAGEVAEDQAAVICRHAPDHADGAVARFARAATVSQLRRVLSDYVWEPEPSEAPEGEQRRRVSFGHRDDGWWRLSAQLAPDEGALVDKALEVARQSLYHQADGAEARHDLSWADALVSMADRSLSPGATHRPARDRHAFLVHLTDGAAHLHLGPALPENLRRYLGCDGWVRPVVGDNAVATSVGRALRIVPTRTRIAVEERDRGCRVPGCDRTRWLQIHHVVHWEDGGGTDTANLVALCSAHHRLHHRGGLGISGDADDPDGVVFTDERGRCLTASAGPAPPGELRLTGTWNHPSGERFVDRTVYFGDRLTRC